MSPNYIITIKEKTEDALDTVFELSGITNTFTLGELLLHKNFVKKRQEEAEKQVEVNNSKVESLDYAFPELQKYTPDAFETIVQYFTTKIETKALEELLEDCRDTLENYEKRLSDIKSLGIDYEGL